MYVRHALINKKRFIVLFSFIYFSIFVCPLMAFSSMNISYDIINDSIKVGSIPCAIGINRNTNKIFIANGKDDSLSVIDGNKDVVQKVVWSGGRTPMAIAVDEESNKIYIANASGVISIINGNDAHYPIVATIKLESEPNGICVDADRKKIYVTCLSSEYMYVIEGRSEANTATDKIKVGTGSWSVVVNNDTNKIYVSNMYEDKVLVIDGITQQKEREIPVGVHPMALSFNPYNNRLYVVNTRKTLDVYHPNGVVDYGPLQIDDSVSIVDGFSNTVLKTVKVGDYPRDIKVGYQGDIYIINAESNDVSVMDGCLNTVNKNLAVGRYPMAAACSLEAQHIYVVNSGDNTVSVVNINDQTE